MSALRTIMMCSVCLAGLAAHAAAQDNRLTRRLGPATAAAVAALVDSAQHHGLPGEPLVQKALEGASKDAQGEAILAAVRALAQRLTEARSGLGTATTGELVAGAGALDAGARVTDLQRLRWQGAQANLTNAFLGLTFLLQRGVAPEHATTIVVSMLEARLSGADFTTLQRLVDQDIRAGAPPAEAARVRSRALIQHGSRLRSREEGGAS